MKIILQQYLQYSLLNFWPQINEVEREPGGVTLQSMPQREGKNG